MSEFRAVKLSRGVRRGEQIRIGGRLRTSEANLNRGQEVLLVGDELWGSPPQPTGVSDRKVQIVRPELIATEEFGQVKILFSVENNGVLEFYIGGDRKKPTRILLTEKLVNEKHHRVRKASLSNTGKGGNEYIASFQLLKDWDIHTDIFGVETDRATEIEYVFKGKVNRTATVDLAYTEDRYNGETDNYYQLTENNNSYITANQNKSFNGNNSIWELEVIRSFVSPEVNNTVDIRDVLLVSPRLTTIKGRTIIQTNENIPNGAFSFQENEERYIDRISSILYKNETFDLSPLPYTKEITYNPSRKIDGFIYGVTGAKSLNLSDRNSYFGNDESVFENNRFNLYYGNEKKQDSPEINPWIAELYPPDASPTLSLRTTYKEILPFSTLLETPFVDLYTFNDSVNKNDVLILSKLNTINQKESDKIIVYRWAINSQVWEKVEERELSFWGIKKEGQEITIHDVKYHP